MKRKSKNKDTITPYLFMSPSLILILLIAIYPIIYTFIISATDLNMNHWKNPSFTGLSNFIKILGSLDGEFFQVLLRTVLWTVINMVVHVALAIVLALVLNIEKLKFKGLYRMILILPWAVPGYISTLIWKGMYNYDFGAINIILKSIGLQPIDWLTKPLNAFAACSIVNVWLATPFMMVVILGALQSIDKSYYEAAILDGATAMQKFKYITFPLLKPAVMPAVVITMFVTFKQFDIVYLLTKGLAGKTDLVITYAYNKAFSDFNYGYSAALSVIIFLILILITSFRKKLMKGAEEVY